MNYFIIFVRDFKNQHRLLVCTLMYHMHLKYAIQVQFMYNLGTIKKKIKEKFVSQNRTKIQIKIR